MIFTVKVSDKGQLTLPAPLRKKMKLNNGGWVLIEEKGSGWVMRSVVAKKEAAAEDQTQIWDTDKNAGE